MPGNSACDDENLRADLSHGPKGSNKRDCCLYCQKLQTKLCRHLTLIHCNEEAVASFSLLPKNSDERRRAIAAIRKKGNFLFNVNSDLNKGSLNPVRRPRTEMKRSGTNFTACPNCKGFYTKNNIRHHYRSCTKKIWNTRGLLTAARQVIGRLHPIASEAMRKRIIPNMQEDDILRIIRYDRIIILYGNKLCMKHRQEYLASMIRSRLRLLGRFLKEMRTISGNISDLASVYEPGYYDKVIEAVNIVAKLNKVTGTYGIPYNASTLGMLLKKIGAILSAEYIKSQEPEKKKNVDEFLTLLTSDYGSSVNYLATETLIKNRRKKKIVIPVTEDIRKLANFLQTKITKYSKELLKKFTYDSWRNLAEVTLISIQIFNRKRAGELERLLITDFNSKTSISKEDEDYKSLTKREQKCAEEYVRVEIKGKLNRTVPILLNYQMRTCIDLIIKNRKMAGVPKSNGYVFGLPRTRTNQNGYLRATKLISKFSTECGAKNPTSLRGTLLRKHIATKCAESHLNENEINHVANFMGHHINIHKNIYRQPKKIDILDMSQVLEKVQGLEARNSSIDMQGLEEGNCSTDNITQDNSLEEMRRLEENGNCLTDHINNNNSLEEMGRLEENGSSSTGHIIEDNSVSNCWTDNIIVDNSLEEVGRLEDNGSCSNGHIIKDNSISNGKLHFNVIFKLKFSVNNKYCGFDKNAKTE